MTDKICAWCRPEQSEHWGPDHGICERHFQEMKALLLEKRAARAADDLMRSTSRLFKVLMP